MILLDIHDRPRSTRRQRESHVVLKQMGDVLGDLGSSLARQEDQRSKDIIKIAIKLLDIWGKGLMK